MAIARAVTALKCLCKWRHCFKAQARLSNSSAALSRRLFMGQLLFLALGRDAISQFRPHDRLYFFVSRFFFLARWWKTERLRERTATNTHVTLRVIFKKIMNFKVSRDFSSSSWTEFGSWNKFFFFGRDCKMMFGNSDADNNSPSVFDSFSMTPPICRSPLTRSVFSTCRSVIMMRIFHVLSPTWIILISFCFHWIPLNFLGNLSIIHQQNISVVFFTPSPIGFVNKWSTRKKKLYDKNILIRWIRWNSN